MLYNDMSKEQKKSFNKLIWFLAIFTVVISTFIINIFSTDSKIEDVMKKSFNSAKIETYNEDYLIVKVSEYMTDEERLTALRNVCVNLSTIKLDSSILVIRFYNKDWSEITRTVTIGMSDIYNTDWSKPITYEEFKNLINY